MTQLCHNFVKCHERYSRTWKKSCHCMFSLGRRDDIPSAPIKISWNCHKPLPKKAPSKVFPYPGSCSNTSILCIVDNCTCAKWSCNSCYPIVMRIIFGFSTWLNLQDGFIYKSSSSINAMARYASFFCASSTIWMRDCSANMLRAHLLTFQRFLREFWITDLGTPVFDEWRQVSK